MRRHYKHSFDRLVFENRWRRRFWNRSSDWTIVGLHKRWFNHEEYEYQICFFGLMLRVWMKRKIRILRNATPEG